MMKKVLLSTLIALAAVSTGASAQVAAPAAQTAAAGSNVPALFHKPVFFRGVVGDINVQVNIRPKADIDEGIEGEYFIFGNSHKILLAGEIEGDQLFMEESENGTNISGQWDGKLEGDSLVGSWMSADGTITKPFTLKAVVQKPAAAPAHAAKKAASNTAKP
ncbi:hypothetical protein DBR37_13905 [Herminiimonas sp. KBW02]|uniref:hypothetical protein n=1 Tax=Herminiimonas sp. KBW02 TaxID=2153363 RepID=UPI000F5B4652|nr:hypothetical protein [Herminiimonas sp. KBW02]RQO33302.1 hypothetical protein DBR37_13905 [Herminiimonas sp. KBW02]